ncbi:MAG: phage portal protein [Patescibacteria group bacterium]|nr:phage portal protein [Patescibacteria group bacterium]
MGLLDFAYRPIARATADYLRTQASADFQKANSPGQVAAPVLRNAIDPNTNNATQRIRGTGQVSFETLRQFSRQHEISRICINARKRQITSLEWDIVASDPEDKTDYTKDIALIKAYFKNLGGYRMRFNKLQDTLIEDLLVMDAAVLYKERNFRGDIMYYMPVDASTIKLRVDNSGSTPEPPEVAYQQYVRGQLTGEYTADEMVYEMINPRTDTPYGLAPLESLIMVVTSALKSTLYNLDFLTAGNIPEGLLTLPENWTMTQIEEYMTYFDSLVAGDSGQMTKMKPIPGGSVFIETSKRSDMAFAEFNMWLMQLTCAMFDIQPQEIGFTINVNKANGSEQGDITTRRGILPLTNLLTEIWDEAIQIDLGFPQLKFKYLGLEDRDQLAEAQTYAAQLSAGILTVDEVRKDMGLEPAGIDTPYVLGTPTFLTQAAVAGEVAGDKTTPTEAHDDTTSTSNDSNLVPDKKKADTPEDRHVELVSELKRFETYAVKRIEAGKSLRKFESEVLPADIVSDLNAKMCKAADKAEARAIIREYKDDYQTTFLEDVIKFKADLKTILE